MIKEGEKGGKLRDGKGVQSPGSNSQFLGSIEGIAYLLLLLWRSDEQLIG